MNYAVRDEARRKKVPFWKIADALEISEATFTRRMRYELPDNEREKILSIIDRIAAEREGA